MMNILPPQKQMRNEIILDFRMSFAFLYAAYQLSTHSLGIRLHEVRAEKKNYAGSHKERIVNERNMLLESLSCAQQSVSYAKFVRGIWSENESFFSQIIEVLEIYIEYIQCQLDENSLWNLIEADSGDLLEKKHGELFEKSGVIAEKIRLLLVSIFEDMQQEERIESYRLNDTRFGALPNLVESLDHIYFELEKILVSE